MAKTIEETLAEKPSSLESLPVRYVETVEAYDKWAEVYDTDGNFLQRLDTLEMRVLLPYFLDCVNLRFKEQIKLVDLGCGTGRNTVQLLEVLSTKKKNQNKGTPEAQVEVIGVDASSGMLDVAQRSIDAFTQNELSEIAKVSLGIFDLLQPVSAKNRPVSLQDCGAAGVISTLVLEHIPLKEFFENASAIMRSGAYLLVTNMHAEMGTISQAGFTDPRTGVKIRPTSYCHSIPEVLDAAAEAGFQVEDLIGKEDGDGVLERAVDEQLGEVLGERAKKWVGIKVWFGVCFSKI